MVGLCEAFNLCTEDIDKEVSREHILKIYFQLERWRRVAAHLGLTQADIQAIESKAKSDEVLTRLYMLQEWKAKNSINKTATYRVLLDVLLQCECSDLAVEVCELLKI